MSRIARMQNKSFILTVKNILLNTETDMLYQARNIPIVEKVFFFIKEEKTSSPRCIYKNDEHIFKSAIDTSNISISYYYLTFIFTFLMSIDKNFAHKNNFIRDYERMRMSCKISRCDYSCILYFWNKVRLVGM